MARHDGWLLADLFRILRRRRGDAHPEPEAPPLDQLIAACEVLMSDIGEASLRAVAARGLQAYRQLDDAARLVFFTHVVEAHGADDDAVRAAYQQWEQAVGQDRQQALTQLFDVVEPARQQLLRRMNHAPDATRALVDMRADLRRLLPAHPELRPLDHDFRHLLVSWFNRGFLRMEEITWDSPKELHQHLLRFEKVHPMADRAELRRRLQPRDRRCYAFFHPATGEVPLIFVEVALVDGIPRRVGPLLDSGPALNPARADTAALYSINNALEGLAGISFGSFLIKQVIEQVNQQLPHLEQFVTLSPIPGFRRWLESQDDPELLKLAIDLAAAVEESPLAEVSGEDGAEAALRERLLPALTRYITEERRADGRPVDPVARFHLGNGAAAWQLHWPAHDSAAALAQSYGAMITYRYEPDELERRHEDFVRHRRVAVDGPLAELADATRPDTTRPEATRPDDPRGPASMADAFTPIHRSFEAQAARQPDKVLFHLPDGGTLTYAETEHTVRRIAARLLADGVEPGDRVAAQVEKSPEALALYLAVLRVGGIFLPLNTAYTGKEMDYFLGDAEPRVLVCSPERQQEHAARTGGGDRAGEVALVIETLGAGGEGTLLSSETTADESFQPDADTPASILYTSGTTGRSKGAVLTHGNLASNCQALLEAWRYTDQDRLIHALPIFHIHGLFVAANMTLVAGASMHWLPTFDAEAILDLMPTSTVLMGVPTFYTRLLKSDRLTPQTCAAMRLFVSGSAPLLAADHEAFEAATGHAILERYGMTETGMNTTNPYDGARKPGTVGRPFPGVQIRITERETGAEVPDGEVGLVEVRGPNVFAEYWRMPEKTASEFREDGFFITGDLGRIDEDGYLCIVGRDKDLVISGGYNIYPKEIEELIDAVDGVAESAVIGVPHSDFGETVVAVVVPQPGSSPEPQGILAAISDDLARFKQPRAVEIVDALPRNVMGKVQKAELRKRYAELFTA
ncbi:AMP-binding protein [Nesterenkonia xinjiangensis]|uniref:Acyl-CoA synthetase (AMP-forming)/AMP-acid ligase II n=1 Tax=Nesterenkonia xinjiangensis TaxID=225327 RepID=A0A7Z0K8M4_9MICC|nr:AMP-binding protein [Nesterenkonia xinjiangensis]NYJ77794.1 acyl-CoA synthetase (AMP-forming)/AMP-acid ligase II [Nesterenkonia xinjiangensis]